MPQGHWKFKKRKNKKQPLNGWSHLHLNPSRTGLTSLPAPEKLLLPNSYHSERATLHTEQAICQSPEPPETSVFILHCPPPKSGLWFPKDSPHVVLHLTEESTISPAKSHRLLDLCNDLSALSAFTHGFLKQTPSTQKLEGPSKVYHVCVPAQDSETLKLEPVGSAGKGACSRAWWTEFDHPDSHRARRGLTPESYSGTLPAHVCT